MQEQDFLRHFTSNALHRKQTQDIVNETYDYRYFM